VADVVEEYALKVAREDVEEVVVKGAVEVYLV
jgi:hypothetical protein